MTIITVGGAIKGNTYLYNYFLVRLQIFFAYLYNQGGSRIYPRQSSRCNTSVHQLVQIFTCSIRQAANWNCKKYLQNLVISAAAIKHTLVRNVKCAQHQDNFRPFARLMKYVKLFAECNVHGTRWRSSSSTRPELEAMSCQAPKSKFAPSSEALSVLNI